MCQVGEFQGGELAAPKIGQVGELSRRSVFLNDF